MRFAFFVDYLIFFNKEEKFDYFSRPFFPNQQEEKCYRKGVLFEDPRGGDRGQKRPEPLSSAGIFFSCACEREKKMVEVEKEGRRKARFFFFLSLSPHAQLHSSTQLGGRSCSFFVPGTPPTLLLASLAWPSEVVLKRLQAFCSACGERS